MTFLKKRGLVNDLIVHIRLYYVSFGFIIYNSKIIALKFLFCPVVNNFNGAFLLNQGPCEE